MNVLAYGWWHKNNSKHNSMSCHAKTKTKCLSRPKAICKCNIFQTKLSEHLNSLRLHSQHTLRKRYIPYNGFGKRSCKAMKHTTQPAGYPNHYSYKEPRLRRWLNIIGIKIYLWERCHIYFLRLRSLWSPLEHNTFIHH